MKTLRKIICILAVPMLLSAQNAFAQEREETSFPSKWIFGKEYTPQFEDEWKTAHRLKATAFGEGTMTAQTSDGHQMERYDIVSNRPVAGPFKEGDCLMFEFPVKDLPSWSVISFDAVVTAENGAPARWQVEWQDGKEWIKGKEVLIYGPAFGKDHKYSSVYQTFRLSEPVAEGHMKVRLRAIGKEIVKKGEEESTAGLMLVPQGYVGAYAQNLGTAVPEDTLKVLCLGNSFTYYHSCPSMLKELAWNEGHCIDMYASLKGSRSMADHLDLEMTNELIALGGYDYVFLQDWSHMATLVGRDKKKYSGRIADMAAVAEKVRTTSPGCKAVVEWTWAYPYMDFAGLGSFRKFHSKSRKGVNLLSRAVGEAVISPIENAFRIVREERPDIEMYHTDRHHQSIYGSYLKSCVNYLVIYGEPYGSNPADCSLPEDIAAYLRSVAERVVL